MSFTNSTPISNSTRTLGAAVAEPNLVLESLANVIGHFSLRVSQQRQVSLVDRLRLCRQALQIEWAFKIVKRHEILTSVDANAVKTAETHLFRAAFFKLLRHQKFIQ